MFSYAPLWKTLINLDISKPDFKKMCNIYNATYTSLNKNEYVSMATIDNICNVLNCDIQDVVEHRKK